MTTYFTADLHLGHRNIIRHCGRPFESAEQMDRHSIEQDVVDVMYNEFEPLSLA